MDLPFANKPEEDLMGLFGHRANIWYLDGSDNCFSGLSHMSKVKSFHTTCKVTLPKKCTGVLARRLLKEWRPRKRTILPLGPLSKAHFLHLLLLLLLSANIRIIDMVQITGREGKCQCWLRAHCLSQFTLPTGI